MVNNRVFKIEENFFDEIDNEEKAYFLGWLFSDGYNSEKYYITLDIKYSDREILNVLSSFIYKNKHPKHIVRKFENGKKSIKICICNQHMCDVLKELGMVKAKSLILKFPDIKNKKVIRHFIRGYLDGDGSIVVHKNRPTIYFFGTYSFLDSLKKILMNEVFISNTKIISASKKSNIFRLGITGKIDVRNLIEYLYKDSNYHLKRKKRKAIEAYEKTRYYSDNKIYFPD